jgi:UPF0176 protein
MPIVGDPIYLREGKLGELKSTELGEKPLCLHAAVLQLVHPLTQETMRFEAAQPDWEN